MEEKVKGPTKTKCLSWLASVDPVPSLKRIKRGTLNMDVVSCCYRGHENLMQPSPQRLLRWVLLEAKKSKKGKGAGLRILGILARIGLKLWSSLIGVLGGWLGFWDVRSTKATHQNTSNNHPITTLQMSTDSSPRALHVIFTTRSGACPNSGPKAVLQGDQLGGKNIKRAEPAAGVEESVVVKLLPEFRVVWGLGQSSEMFEEFGAWGMDVWVGTLVSKLGEILQVESDMIRLNVQNDESGHQVHLLQLWRLTTGVSLWANLTCRQQSLDFCFWLQGSCQSLPRRDSPIHSGRGVGAQGGLDGLSWCGCRRHHDASWCSGLKMSTFRYV